MYRVRNLYQEGKKYKELERPAVGFECRRNGSEIDFYIFAPSVEFLKLLSKKINNGKVSLQILQHNSVILYTVDYKNNMKMRTLECPSLSINNLVQIGLFGNESIFIPDLKIRFHCIDKNNGMVWGINTFTFPNISHKFNELLLKASESGYNPAAYQADAMFCQNIKDQELKECKEYCYFVIDFSKSA